MDWVAEWRGMRSYNYGVPVTYWRKLVSVKEAEQSLYPFADDEKPIWQEQYLIKTKGFKYDCWDAPRILDEPVQVLMRLNDGTVLLGGNRSVLRVRENDGSTNAPTNQVKVFDSVFVRQELDEHGAKSCSNLAASLECGIFNNLGWQQPKPWNIDSPDKEKKFYRLVVKSVDTVLQNLFDVSY